jgi:hypothetical protein
MSDSMSDGVTPGGICVIASLSFVLAFVSASVSVGNGISVLSEERKEWFFEKFESDLQNK